MEIRRVRNLTLWFDVGEEAAADLVGRACERGLDLLRDLWDLAAPDECRVYVMTSWSRVLFHPAPWPWRVYLAITLPLRYARIQKLWAMAGGWALRYGQRRIIGIKPPHLLRQVDPGLRDRVFVQREMDEAVEHNTCHELTHACSDHLRLPTWLHEGLAMVTVDHFAGKPTVKAETLGTWGERPDTPSQARFGSRTSRPDSLLSLAVRGYWITRYLAEVHPTLLWEQLAHRQSHKALESALATGVGLDPEEFWTQIDGLVISHFRDGR